MIHSKLNIIQLRIILICGKGVGMIRVDFGPISETVYIDIILNTKGKNKFFFDDFTLSFVA